MITTGLPLPTFTARRLLRALSVHEPSGAGHAKAGFGDLHPGCEFVELEPWPATTTTTLKISALEEEAAEEPFEETVLIRRPRALSQKQQLKRDQSRSPSPFPSRGISRTDSFDSTRSRRSTTSSSSSSSTVSSDEVNRRWAEDRQRESENCWREFWG